MVKADLIKKHFITSTDNSRIYYDTYYTQTTKRPLLLLHGATGDASTWNGFRDIFHQSGYSTIAVDLRGHGFSDRGTKNEFYEVERIVEDILQIIKAEKLKEYVLVGQCYGATILTKVAAQKPPGLYALVILNSSFKSGLMSMYMKLPFKKTLISFIEKLPNLGNPGQTDFTKFIGTGNFHIGRIITTAWKTTSKSVLFTFDKVFSINTEKDLKHVNVPVCIIGGTKDAFFPPKSIYALGEKLQGSSVHILEDADHIMCLNKPQEVTELLLKFLKKIKN